MPDEKPQAWERVQPRDIDTGLGDLATVAIGNYGLAVVKFPVATVLTKPWNAGVASVKWGPGRGKGFGISEPF